MFARHLIARPALKGVIAALVAISAIYATRPANTIFAELDARGVSPKPTLFMHWPGRKA